MDDPLKEHPQDVLPPSLTIMSARDDYFAKRKRMEYAENIYNEAKSAANAAKAKLRDSLIEAGQTGLPCADGTNCVLTNGITLSVTKDNEQEVRDFITHVLREDDVSFETTSISKKDLVAYVREQLKNKKLAPHQIPESLGFNRWTNLLVKGWENVPKVWETKHHPKTNSRG